MRVRVRGLVAGGERLEWSHCLALGDALLYHLLKRGRLVRGLTW